MVALAAAAAAGLFGTPSSWTIDTDELRTGSISVKVYYLVMGAIYPLVTGFDGVLLSGYVYY